MVRRRGRRRGVGLDRADRTRRRLGRRHHRHLGTPTPNPRFDGAWLIDHLQGWFPRGASGGVLPDPHQLLDPFSVLAAGAAATTRVPLGVAVTDPLRRNSVALAQAAGTIGWLGGRPMRLGLGVGDPGQLRPFGIHPGRERTGRLDYIRPALDQLDRLRTPGHGGLDAPDLGIAAQTGYELYVAAHGPRMLELAASVCDGWIPSSLSPQAYRDKLELLRGHAERRGRNPDTIRPTLFVWSALAPSEPESRALLAHPSVRAVALYRGPAGFEAHGATYPPRGRVRTRDRARHRALHRPGGHLSVPGGALRAGPALALRPEPG